MSALAVIEPRLFCEQRREFVGSFIPTQLPRVLDSVVDSSGSIEANVAGSLDARGRPALRLVVRADLGVICQRCLKPMRVAVDVDEVLVFGEEPAGTTELDPDQPELLPMVERLDLIELLEEEVLLALPMLPRHDECEGPAAAGPQRDNPFGVLKALTGGKTDNE